MCSYVVIYRGLVILWAHNKAASIWQTQYEEEGVASYNCYEVGAHLKIPTSEETKGLREKGHYFWFVK